VLFQDESDVDGLTHKPPDILATTSMSPFCAFFLFFSIYVVLLEDEPDLIRLEPEDQESFSPIENKLCTFVFVHVLFYWPFPHLV
jgi:hypothetical protein